MFTPNEHDERELTHLYELFRSEESSLRLKKDIWNHFKRIAKKTGITRVLLMEFIASFAIEAPPSIGAKAIRLFKKMCPADRLLEYIYNLGLLSEKNKPNVKKIAFRIFKVALLKKSLTSKLKDELQTLNYMLIDKNMASHIRADIWNILEKFQFFSFWDLKKVYSDDTLPIAIRIAAFEKDLDARREKVDRFQAPWYSSNVPKKLKKKVFDLEARLKKLESKRRKIRGT